MILLGRHQKPSEEEGDILPGDLVKVRHQAFGLFAYLISPVGAKRLAAELFPLRFQLDTELTLRLQKLRVFKPSHCLAWSSGSAPGNTDVQRVPTLVEATGDLQ